jgi:hypothetical protein
MTSGPDGHLALLAPPEHAAVITLEDAAGDGHGAGPDVRRACTGHAGMRTLPMGEAFGVLAIEVELVTDPAA